MPSTTDDPRVSAIEERMLRDASPSPGPFKYRCDSSSSHPISPKPGANVYYLVPPAPESRAEPTQTSMLRLWWSRWYERRRFARELPWMADEVLEDYGLTRKEARRLCRRPFWQA
ncbi:DUF1127 domain-containing protein [Bradyrhizobium sp. HKCCYLRH1073]|uniref:DUF1127 domain-containing protein n=1 Tax=unclassified Bradyrhizobium TaxID=2631580 RepID=UPI003EC0653F